MAKRKRARTESGQFVADDPNTPENEAWVTVGGVEASGTTDNEAEPEKFKPMTWKEYAILGGILLIMSLNKSKYINGLEFENSLYCPKCSASIKLD